MIKKFAAICVLLHSLQLGAEQLKLTPPLDLESMQYAFKWDSAQEMLILYRSVTSPNEAAVRAYGSKTAPALTTYPLRDFPGAQGLNIWSVAGMPDGGVAVAGIINYGGHQIKQVLLQYDNLGVLRQLWDVFPRHAHEIAVDREGNIYSLAEQVDAREDNYSLMVKYSPTAKVVVEFLPARLFPGGSDVVSANPTTGVHQMFINGDELYLYLATTKELFRFGLDGSLRSHTKFDRVLSDLAKATMSEWAEILCLAVGKHGDLVAQMRLWPKDDPATRKVQFLMVQLSPDGKTWERLSPVSLSRYPGPFIGVLRTGKMLFLRPNESGIPVMEELEKLSD